MDFIVALGTLIKDWALTPPGVVFLCALAAFGWLGRKVVARWESDSTRVDSATESRIKAMEANLLAGESRMNMMWAEVRIALLECRAESVIDHDHLHSMRALASEYRALVIATFTGQRSPPPELEALDLRWKALRQRIHDEVGRRAEKLQRDVLVIQKEQIK
jgi:hypothetical protein